jgi:hypothetical protein
MERYTSGSEGESAVDIPAPDNCEASSPGELDSRGAVLEGEPEIIGSNASVNLHKRKT